MARVRTTRQEYLEYLRTEHWRELRARLLQSRPVCERCGRNEASECHHLNYRNLLDVTPRDLLALCRDCHKAIHIAIDFCVIRNRSSRKEALTVADESIRAARSRASGRHKLPTKTLETLNACPIYIQRRVCGVLKQPHPDDFMEWDGVKVGPRQLQRVRGLAIRGRREKMAPPRVSKRRRNKARKARQACRSGADRKTRQTASELPRARA